MEAPHSEECPVMPIAGFWRRLFALVIDLFLLGVAGMILGGLLFDPLARIGALGRLIGFAVALAYFGLGNSNLLDGQTVGKMLLGLRVVDMQGRPLSLPRSMLRYCVLGVPFFMNGLPVGPAVATNAVFGALLALIVFGAMFSVVYLYVFNRQTRQSLHDLVAGSLVVAAEPRAALPSLPPLWRGHLVVLAVIGVLALGGPMVAARLVKSQPFAGLWPLYGELSHQPHVMNAQVVHGWMRGNGSETHYLQARLSLDAPLTEDADFARRMAVRMANAEQGTNAEDAIVVDLVYGYDLGIATGWKSHRYAFRPDALR